MKPRISTGPKADYMRLAIKEAKKNFKSAAGGPFGACIVKDGVVLAVAANSVLKNNATCHAEMNAICLASKRIKNFDLSGCVIYSTTEPCPMCFSAIHWARIDEVIYGTAIKDVNKRGFNELKISAERLKNLGGSKVRITKGFLFSECELLLEDWDRLDNKRLY